MAGHQSNAGPVVPDHNQHILANHDEDHNASETSSTTVADRYKEQPPSRPVNHAHFGEDQVKTISEKEGTATDGTRELTEDECRDELGFGFSTFKKW